MKISQILKEKDEEDFIIGNYKIKTCIIHYNKIKKV